MSNTTIIWEDKKRIFGKPISFTKYSLTENRLICTKGLLTETRDSINVFRIIDVQMVATITQRLFKVGTIIIYTNDLTHPEFRIENVLEPNKVMDTLEKIVRQSRKSNNVRMTEFVGDNIGGNYD